MSVTLYDKAIIDELQRLTQDTRIHIAPAENVFATVGKLENTFDFVELPLLSVTRTGWSIQPPQHSQKFEGVTYQYDVEKDYVQNLQMIPIQINYLLDVWSKTREENDIICRELIFYFFNHPTMKVTVPYDADYVHNFNIFFNNDVEDNSDIVEHKNRGEYFRQTLSFYTDDAYLWKTSSRPFTKIELELWIEDSKIKAEEKWIKDGEFYAGSSPQ